MSTEEQPVETHAVRDHAILGGSSALRWVNCPGSVFYTKDLPAEESSEAAIEGTKAHEFAECALSEFLDYQISGNPPDVATSLLNQCDDETMLSHVNDYVSHIWTKLLEESITGKAYGIEDSLILNEQLDMAGIVDFWAVYLDDRGKRVGVIADFKYGFHVVDVEKNAQLAFYACALRKFLQDNGKDLDYVRAAIFQPRAMGSSYKETKFTAKQLTKWHETFLKSAKTIFVDKKPKFKAGEHCRWCRAKAVCPTYAKQAQTKMALNIIEPRNIALPVPEKLTDEQILRVINNAGVLEDFIAACKTYALDRYQRGTPIKGTKLVEGSTRKTWDTESVPKLTEHLFALGLSSDDIFNKKIKSISDITKILKKSDYSDEQIKPFITQTKPSLNLVSENDERPAVKTLLTSIEETK